jgi:hypothetical protein
MPIENATASTKSPALNYRGRGISWLRRQFQFSLATLLEWLAAYCIAFLVVWIRAEYPWLSAGVLVALVLAVLLRPILRPQCRRLAHMLIFVFVIALGIVVGALLLTFARRGAAEHLVAEDQRTMEAIEHATDAHFSVMLYDAESRVLEALKPFSGEPDEQEAKHLLHEMAVKYAPPAYSPEDEGITTRRDAFDYEKSLQETAEKLAELAKSAPTDANTNNHKLETAVRKLEAFSRAFTIIENLHQQFEREARIQLSLIKTRDMQMRDISEETGLWLTPLPASPQEWSPTRVAPEKRRNLRITFDFVDTSCMDLPDLLLQTCGMRCDFECDPAVYQPLSVRFMEMKADLSIDWIFKLLKAEAKVDWQSGILHIGPPTDSQK